MAAIDSDVVVAIGSDLVAAMDFDLVVVIDSDQTVVVDSDVVAATIPDGAIVFYLTLFRWPTRLGALDGGGQLGRGKHPTRMGYRWWWFGRW